MKTLHLALSVVLLQWAAAPGSLALDKGEPHSLTRAAWCAEALKQCEEELPKKNCSDIPLDELARKTECFENWKKICAGYYGSESTCMSADDPEK